MDHAFESLYSILAAKLKCRKRKRMEKEGQGEEEHTGGAGHHHRHKMYVMRTSEDVHVLVTGLRAIVILFSHGFCCPPQMYVKHRFHDVLAT